MDEGEQGNGGAVALSAAALAELLTTREGILTLDCRSFIVFNKLHIVGAANVTCPTLVLKRLQQRSRKRRPSHSGRDQCVLLEKLLASQQELREQCAAGQVRVVVLVGDVGEEPLTSLLTLLHGDVAELYYLQDDFSTFADAYAHLCVAEECARPNDHYVAPPPSAVQRKENMAMEPTEILPYLYLGNQRNSTDIVALRALKINYVLNVAKELENSSKMQQNGLHYKYLPLIDSTEQDIHQYLGEAFDFIETARRNDGKVLVHCVGGISRSVAVTLAYLMRTQHMSLDNAYTFMKSRKANISPNISFMGQLLEFERAERERTAHGEQVSHPGASDSMEQ